MSDLSRLLEDVYRSSGAGPTAPAAPAAPSWSSDEALDDAFADWIPGPPGDAPAAERSFAVDHALDNAAVEDDDESVESENLFAEFAQAESDDTFAEFAELAHADADAGANTAFAEPEDAFAEFAFDEPEPTVVQPDSFAELVQPPGAPIVDEQPPAPRRDLSALAALDALVEQFKVVDEPPVAPPAPLAPPAPAAVVPEVPTVPAIVQPVEAHEPPERFLARELEPLIGALADADTALQPPPGPVVESAPVPEPELHLEPVPEPVRHQVSGSGTWSRQDDDILPGNGRRRGLALRRR
jgi:hypothetical protein